MSNFTAPAAYRRSLSARADNTARANGCEVYAIRYITKAGTPAKTETDRVRGTREQADERVAQLEKLNPGSRFVVSVVG